MKYSQLATAGHLVGISIECGGDGRGWFWKDKREVVLQANEEQFSCF